MMMGTIDYASPEIVRNTASSELTVGVDLWSLGCVLYAMWIGEAPFHALSDALATEAIVRFVALSESEQMNWLTKQEADASNDMRDADPEGFRPPDQWMDLIGGLLRPIAMDRLGATDFNDMTENDRTKDAVDTKPFRYSSIRNHPALTSTSADEFTTVRDVDQDNTERSNAGLVFKPPPPDWLLAANNQTENPLRDGADGWEVFLL